MAYMQATDTKGTVIYVNIDHVVYIQRVGEQTHITLSLMRGDAHAVLAVRELPEKLVGGGPTSAVARK